MSAQAHGARGLARCVRGDPKASNHAGALGAVEALLRILRLDNPRFRKGGQRGHPSEGVGTYASDGRMSPLVQVPPLEIEGSPKGSVFKGGAWSREGSRPGTPAD
eukprot:1184994-Prorocentrum_minimum.AAC.1